MRRFIPGIPADFSAMCARIRGIQAWKLRTAQMHVNQAAAAASFLSDGIQECRRGWKSQLSISGNALIESAFEAIEDNYSSKTPFADRSYAEHVNERIGLLNSLDYSSKWRVPHWKLVNAEHFPVPIVPKPRKANQNERYEFERRLIRRSLI